MTYFDYAASTPVDKEVLDTYYQANLDYFANPNSNHVLGLEAKNKLDEVTKHISSLLDVSNSEIIYTSGSTESNNLAIKGICQRYKNFGKHILISSLEHNSIVSSCTRLTEEGFQVDLIPIDKNGRVDISVLKSMIRDDTILVSVCSVDSEIGLKQPIEEIGELLKEYPHCVFHTDATQAIGRVSIDFSDVDLITFAPHKFYGLNGIGVLVKKDGIMLKPILDGGKSTTVYRSGTPDLSSVIALDKALDIAITKLDSRYSYVEGIYHEFLDFFKEYKNVIVNNTKDSIPYTINFSLKGVKSNDLVDRLSQEGIIVSAKTSCCPVETPSKLVYALTKDKSLATTSVRISLSHLTTEEDIKHFFQVFDRIYKEIA